MISGTFMLYLSDSTKKKTPYVYHCSLLNAILCNVMTYYLMNPKVN